MKIMKDLTKIVVFKKTPKIPKSLKDVRDMLRAKGIYPPSKKIKLDFG